MHIHSHILAADMRAVKGTRNDLPNWSVISQRIKPTNGCISARKTWSLRLVGRVVLCEHLPTRVALAHCNRFADNTAANQGQTHLQFRLWMFRIVYEEEPIVPINKQGTQQWYFHHVWHYQIPLPSFHSLFHHSNSAPIVLVLMVDLVQAIKVNQEPMNCWQLAWSESTTNLRRSLSLLHGLAPIGWDCLPDISTEKIPITFLTECGHANVWVGQGKQHDSSLLVVNKIMGKCFNLSSMWHGDLLNVK